MGGEYLCIVVGCAMRFVVVLLFGLFVLCPLFLVARDIYIYIYELIVFVGVLVACVGEYVKLCYLCLFFSVYICVLEWSVVLIVVVCVVVFVGMVSSGKRRFVVEFSMCVLRFTFRAEISCSLYIGLSVFWNVCIICFCVLFVFVNVVEVLFAGVSID